MTQIVRSIRSEPQAQPERLQLVGGTQLRFLLRKLSLRRGQTVVVIGCPELDAVRNLADCVGDTGSISILLTPEQLQFGRHYVEQLEQLASKVHQLTVGKLGPSLESQQADAMVIMPDRLMPPYEPLLDQAWRRLNSGGRLMLVLPHGEAHTQRLYELIDTACQCGFVSRYRRCCDKHTAWVGVKYSNKS
ncbi:hypothetical protein [uncultured Ferrimonas sp.]|uniref:hypothetical protein n=1 Tax=uncultured Ferrimonas sp. TaxID=432640 RepID=UPI0026254C7A|nr:hypothetical protein [uncultured Ferrimonas sp.]